MITILHRERGVVARVRVSEGAFGEGPRVELEPGPDAGGWDEVVRRELLELEAQPGLPPDAGAVRRALEGIGARVPSLRCEGAPLPELDHLPTREALLLCGERAARASGQLDAPAARRWIAELAAADDLRGVRGAARLWLAEVQEGRLAVPQAFGLALITELLAEAGRGGPLDVPLLEELAWGLGASDALQAGDAPLDEDAAHDEEGR
ncbi:MAG: hypothetical protein AB7N76_06150 [Planctomycetota bacterium]